MQRICLESSSMRPTPSPSGSTPCRSGWTDSPSVSPSWTPKKRSVSTHTNSTQSCATKCEFSVKYKQLMHSRVSCVVKSPHTCSFLLMATIEMSAVCELTQFQELTVQVLPQLSNIPASVANKHPRFLRGNWISDHIVSEVGNNNKEWRESSECKPGYRGREDSG